MKYFGVRMLKLEFSDSKKTYPDIWISLDGQMPKITVTREWMKQSSQERHKRLAHELGGHYAFKWNHNEYMDKVGFSTYPNKDTMSPRIYKDLISRRKLRKPQEYIQEALNELDKRTQRS